MSALANLVKGLIRSSLLPHLVPQHLVRDTGQKVKRVHRNQAPERATKRGASEEVDMTNMAIEFDDDDCRPDGENKEGGLQGGVLTLRGGALASGRSSDLGTRAGR